MFEEKYRTLISGGVYKCVNLWFRHACWRCSRCRRWRRKPDNYPKAEVFGGYQYFLSLGGGVRTNGFDFDLNGNFNNYFGITADFGTVTHDSEGVSLHNYTYTFGPVLSLRANKAYTPFVHALIGGDHASASLAGSA